MRIQSSHHHAARGLDAYFSPPEATAALLAIEHGRLPRRLSEPAAGNGAIVRPLRVAHFDVVASDLVGYGGADIMAGVDYLVAPLPAGVMGIVTNLPAAYSHCASDDEGTSAKPTAGMNFLPMTGGPIVTSINGKVLRMKLYSARTIVKVYKGHRDVAFSWFACREPGFFRWPHAELIADYDRLDDECRFYAGDAADDLFDKTEADALAAYLEREHAGEGETTIKEVKLPLPGNIIGLSHIPVGGGTGWHQLNEEPAYSLPFRVWGYYDLRHCEPVDKSLPARHQFCSLYIHDGKINQ